MSAEEKAIDNYLLWELCKQKGIQRKIMEGSYSREELRKEIVEKMRKEYRKKDYDSSEKIALMQDLDNNPDYRTKIFKECSWKSETVSLEDLGTTLPRLGGIPPEVISGPLKDVIDFVREADSEEYQSVNYIRSLKEVPEVLNEFYPWVITPGKRPSKRDRMNKVHGEKNWKIADTWGMINDGNHRAIAKILSNNLKEIECYVGYRQSHQ